MITGIRSAVLCDEVQQSPDGDVNYIGLANDPVYADCRPAILPLYVALHLESDRRAGRGRMTLQAPDHPLQSIPFEIPAGHRLVSVACPIVLTCRDPGELIVTVYDDSKPRRPYRVTWEIDFLADAVELDAEGLEEAEGLRQLAVSAMDPQRLRPN